MKNIKIFSKNLSCGVQLEVEALKSMADKHIDILEKFTSLEEYVSYSNAPMQYQFALNRVKSKKTKILDIGVGRGGKFSLFSKFRFSCFCC